MITKSEIRPGAYYDSVVLMQLQRSLAELPGVDDAGVVMATPANKELLADFDLLTKEADNAGADDLLIVVRSEDEKSALAAIEQVDELMKKRRSSVASEFRPRSMDAAVKQLPDADWVLISVPGRYAAGVAQEALNHGKHVFLYSDNVSIEDELKLKQSGQEKGLLVMGPDCGTAIINGIGLGFANRVRKGKIGLVGASGTGLQAITTHIHNLGGGVSQAIGTGGRDLKAKIGGITAMQGLEVLAQDAETDVIVLVSKPPDAQVAAQLMEIARAIGKPVVVDFLGYPPPGKKIANLHFAASLDDAAQLAVSLSKQKLPKVDTKSSPGFVRGLFSGGTLAYQAMLGLQAILSPIYSNVPITPEQNLEDPLNSKAHTIVDLGEDIFTVGRLHPMMDNDLRIRRLKEEVEDIETGVILLDIVLGEGSHPNPVEELAPAIKDAAKQRKEIIFVAIVIGTDEDPQETSEQLKQLEKAGVEIFRTTTDAVNFIAGLYTGESKSDNVKMESFSKPLAAINVGLESFYDSLKGQGSETVHVDWRPPAGGNEKLMAILAKMNK